MNIQHLIVNLKDWLDDIKIYIKSKFISGKNKTNILNQARNISQNILRKNGLNYPFTVYLDRTGDELWRTKAWYQPQSSRNGIVEIHVRSNFITENIDFIVHCILHEYVHAIFEDGFELDIHLCFEINKLMNLILPKESIENIFDIAYYEFKKEYFCNWFAQYLINGSKNNEEIEEICNSIIQKYNHLHPNHNIVPALESKTNH